MTKLAIISRIVFSFCSLYTKNVKIRIRMLELELESKWSHEYSHQVSRNIGHVSPIEQEILRTTPIGVFGVGGLGGLLSEQLVRVGCEHLVICDRDVFEPSNLNRQICMNKHMGDLKIDVVAEHLEKINPKVQVRKFNAVNLDTIDSLLNDVKIVALTLDDPIGSILIARECRKRNIPMVETWGIPYIWSFWFTQSSIDYETCYDLDTHDMTIEELFTSGMTSFGDLFPKLTQFPRIGEIYDRYPGMWEKMKRGEVPYRSFAPFIGISASYLCAEIIFAGLLGVKPMNLAPNVVGFDYLRMIPFHFEME